MLANHQALLAFTLLVSYFALHSILAADRVKAWFSVKLGTRFRYYRLIYNGIATILLMVLLGWMGQWPRTYLFQTNAWTCLIAFLLMATGAWLGIGSFRQYDLGEFTGIEQLNQKTAQPHHSQLNTSGFNAIVRHPLYLGILLMVVGGVLIFPTHAALILLSSVVVYLPFGIYFEEIKLRRQFGQLYLDYEKRVKRLIPGLW